MLAIVETRIRFAKTFNFRISLNNEEKKKTHENNQEV
jgi:hypothetical protein